MTKTELLAVEGWFADSGDGPHLIGSCCVECGSYFFPKTVGFCANPACTSDDLEDVPLSRRGKIWSYTTHHYQPPEPYMVPVPELTGDDFRPYTVAAVELATEGLVVLGQVVDGVGAEQLKVGDEVELVIDTLFEDDDERQIVWKWAPVEKQTA